MANVSPQKQALASLVSSTRPERIGFNPYAVEHLSERRKSKFIQALRGDRKVPLFFRGSVAFPAIQEVGNFCVAVYDTTGPALERVTNRDMIHGSCDAAVLLEHQNGHAAALHLLQPAVELDSEQPTAFARTGASASYARVIS